MRKRAGAAWLQRSKIRFSKICLKLILMMFGTCLGWFETQETLRTWFLTIWMHLEAILEKIKKSFFWDFCTFSCFKSKHFSLKMLILSVEKYKNSKIFWKNPLIKNPLDKSLDMITNITLLHWCAMRMGCKKNFVLGKRQENAIFQYLSELWLVDLWKSDFQGRKFDFLKSVSNHS